MKEINANILEGKYEEILAAVQSPVIALTELIKNAADSCQNITDPIIVKIHTESKTIEIIDEGEGICEKEIERLGEAGYSSKMVGKKTMSPIDNPLSGSKGLGLLTAFFVSDLLEIETFSKEEQKLYFLRWKKGEQKFSYEERVEPHGIGTRILLKNVEEEKLRMILLQEEKQKLFMTSLRFFTDDERLPRIRLFVDEKEEFYYPSETIEDFYNRNKADNKGFIAKASFEYVDNKITLSYEDNISGFYTFNNQIIDLSNRASVDVFATNIKAPERGGVPVKKIAESDLFEESYCSISVPKFSGVLYTWRDKKDEQLEQWPVGVRIYINDYSMYRYLDKDNDWLNLSEISQNVKATNYKLKNTYGYLNLPHYNENLESLKISKERNDFVDSLAQRKFIKIMRDIIVAAFTRIDIAVKNPPIQSIGLRQNSLTVRVGEKISLGHYLICNNLGLDDITVSYDENELTVDEDWNVSAKSHGNYKIKFSYKEQSCEMVLNFKDKVPEFCLSKTAIEVYKGNTVNLQDYIIPSSCKDVTLDSIQIIADNQATIICNDLFSKDNAVGRHVVLYKYGEFQRTLVINVKEIEKQPGGGAKTPRIDELFPKLDMLRNKSFKIPELVDAISSYYIEAPTLCMAAIRILVEASCKAYFQHLKNEENDFSFPSLVSRTMNLQSCVDTAPDYKNYVAVHEQAFIDSFKNVSAQYNTTLSKDVKANINNHINTIDLNMFVHNPLIIATDTTVFKTMQIFSPLLNYVFDVLLIE